MITRKANTRFMNGNIDVDGVICDLLVNANGWDAVMSTGITFDDVIFSDGFVGALENGLTPVLSTIEKSFMQKKSNEYHHFIFEDECYVMYFE